MAELAPRYEIANLWDFLDVPPSRLGECLADFHKALITTQNLHRSIEAGAHAVGAALSRESLRRPATFIWVDAELGRAPLASPARPCRSAAENEKMQGAQA